MAAVLGLGGRECGRDLVDQLPLLPELTGEVEEHLQLRGDVPEAGRRAEGDPVRPLDVLELRFRLILELGAMTAPVLLERDQHLLPQLSHASEKNLGALVGGTFGDRAGERVHVAGRAVVDDCDPGHASNVGRVSRDRGSPGFL